MALFLVRQDFFGVGFGLNDLAGLLLVGVAVFRRPQRELAGVRWFPVLCGIVVVYLSVVAISTGPTAADVSRLGRIGIMMLLAGFIASGRIDLASGLKGFAGGLAANVALFYAGLAPNNYGGVLTGYLGDKNVAGLTYAVMTLLVLLIPRRTWVRVVFFALGAGAVFMTGSRTSLGALAAALVWLWLARYLGPLFKTLLGLGLYSAFYFVETNFAQVGEYATRAGSDELRERIDAASLEKVLSAPWYGHGLGEAVTEVADETWFFHNSYWGLIAEGGYPLLVTFLLLAALAGFQIFSKGKSSADARIVESATVVLLLCSLRLGEVFITQPAFIVFGIGLAIYARRYQAWQIDEHDKLVTGPRNLLRSTPPLST